MGSQLKLRFDANQDYQLDAIESVVRLFEGLDRRNSDFRLSEEIVPNLPPQEALAEPWLSDNLAAVQRDAGLPEAAALLCDEGMVLEGAGSESWRHPNFTVEMETGTGKTYVYLRTIHELRKRFGFGKFVVVVPSVAIYEGVIKTFEMTQAHFAALYGNERINLVKYDGSQLSRLRPFATSTFAEILLITLDSFNKASGRGANNLYKVSEKLPGERRPFQYIQDTRPILILDEPQNMESARAREALRTLHPLFALRYSATHRSSPNLVYRLTPFEAYRRNLVKRIQVVGVTEIEDFNQPFLRLDEVSQSGGIRAHLTTYVQEDGRARERQVVLRAEEELQGMTGRDDHAGYTVDEIHVGEQWIRFANGITLHLGDTIGPSRPEIFKAQIEETIRQHFETQERLQGRGIKVLSLFFVDRVASYMDSDGLVRKLFDSAFERLRGDYPHASGLSPGEVRRAYFATQKIGRAGDEVAVDLALDDVERNQAQRELARQAFNLIMRDKERLLSFEEPVSFIFAHSALKEGWDNPNVFQICTLNQTASETKKRQEIGRGLRLCVDQSGERVHGEETNILTVIANESYRSYATRLQKEYVQDGDGSAAPPSPSDARRKKARRRDALFVAHDDFVAFWNKLALRVEYSMHLDTERLVARATERLNAEHFPEPRIVIEKGEFVVNRYTLTLEQLRPPPARLKIAIKSSTGDDSEYVRTVREGDNLGDLIKDDRLRGLVVREPRTEYLALSDDVELYEGEPVPFESAEGQRVRVHERRVADERHAVFNVVARGAQVSGLTRTTVARVFRSLRPEIKQMVFRNPEGFAGVFCTTLKNVVSDQVAASLEFRVAGSAPIDLEELFPAEKTFPQKELVEAGVRGLYDLVQKDSDVELTFVERLKRDDQVVLFFKFPAAFKVRLPRLIGNYNPDWGIVRRGPDGGHTLHLVRETKGSERLDTLRFPHERRKIIGAAKYFGAAGVDYRPIAGSTLDWWEPWGPNEELGLD